MAITVRNNHIEQAVREIGRERKDKKLSTTASALLLERITQLSVEKNLTLAGRQNPNPKSAA
ncbi:MAG TPA: hypothetical protein PK402_04160 [Tepidisphaeraceae bacterium]|nr:hypothetical protein [Tepidisphaeraceae bacterium]